MRRGSYWLFDYHKELHYSQTVEAELLGPLVFDYHKELHYSQTEAAHRWRHQGFDYHKELHYSQTSNIKFGAERFPAHYKNRASSIW